MASIKAVIFDWDGTVVDTMPLKIQNASEAFSRVFGACPRRVKETYEKYSGVPRKELFQFIAQESIGRKLSHSEFQQLSAEFTRTNLENYKKNSVFDEASRSALQSLKKKGLRLFVSSSAVQDEVMGLAVELGLDNLFDEILGSRDGFRKGKEHIQYLSDAYQIPVHQMAMVGDERADIRLSQKVGVMAIGVTRHKTSDFFKAEYADHVVAHLGELEGVLDND